MAKYAFFETKDGASNNRQLMKAIMKKGEIVGWEKVVKYPPMTVVDEEYVAEKVEEADPVFKGTHTTMSAIVAIPDADENDWAYLQEQDAAGNDVFSRYRYTRDGVWRFEVSIKRDNFTDQEWAAITSGINSSKVEKLDDLAQVAVTGSYNDLEDKPVIPTVPTDVSAFNNDVGYLTSHQDISGKADIGNPQDEATENTIYGVKAFLTGTINTESAFQKNFAAIMSLCAMPEFGINLSVTTTGWKIVVTDANYNILMGKRSDDTWYFSDNLDTILDEVISGYTPTA
ncbi:MAG: hypothetical protein IJQ13_04595 [Prevotella sp.]|nr:hypothetical protein [Prevotella sp.]